MIHFSSSTRKSSRLPYLHPFDLDMPSDQHKMYEYAINMAQLLSSDLPEDDAAIQIEKLVVSKIIPPISKPYLRSYS
jgi:hypothetical protein